MRARGGFLRRSPPLALPLASVTLPDRSSREETPQLYLRCRRPFAGSSLRSAGPSSCSPSPQRLPPPLPAFPPPCGRLLPVFSPAPPFPGFSLPTLRLSFLGLRPSFPLLRLFKWGFSGPGHPPAVPPCGSGSRGRCRAPPRARPRPSRPGLARLIPAGPSQRAVAALRSPRSGEPAPRGLLRGSRGGRPPAAAALPGRWFAQLQT